MKMIKQLLFGKRVSPIESISNGIHHTIQSNKQPSFDQWCKEFKVGMLYDRKIVEMN